MATTTSGSQNPARSDEGLVGRFLRDTELDTRMIGMVAALAIIWIGFHVFGGWWTGNSVFLTPRNLWNLLVQTSSIAVMTTGMVLIIVMRQIDLSVGSMLGLIAAIMGVAQVYWLGPALGVGHPAIWILAVLLGLGMGALIGGFQGYLIAYGGIPSFIVTLGGLIVWRGAAFTLAKGETVAPMDRTYALIGGGPMGAIGATASWIVGVIVCAGIIWAIISGRQQRRRFRFPVRPIWAEILIGILGCVTALAATWLVNIYYWPPGVVKRWAEEHAITVPEAGLDISHGYAIPVLIALGVGVVMTFLATRTTFGRYVYAIGGNPEAAELAGINTKRMTVMMFGLMGVLAAISAVISSARLNAATISMGQTDELYVIAAAVIGGTSLAGGLGTISGAMLGALVMQSLQSGMTLLNFDAAAKDIAVGSVLVLAVWIDQVYRRRMGNS